MPAHSAGSTPLAPAVDRWTQEQKSWASWVGTVATAACRQAGFEPDARYTTTDLQIHLRLVESGLAAALLPDLSGPGDRHDVIAHRLHGHPRRQIFTTVRSGAGRHPKVQAFTAALRAHGPQPGRGRA